MTTRTPERDTLYERLRRVLGNDEAATLMELLPEDRDRLAAKSDINRLNQAIDGLDQRMEKFEDRLWDFHEALRDQTRVYITASVASMIGVGGMAFAIAALV